MFIKPERQDPVATSVSTMYRRDLEGLIGDIERVTRHMMTGSLEVRYGLLGIKHVAEWVRDLLPVKLSEQLDAPISDLIGTSNVFLMNRWTPLTQLPWGVTPAILDMTAREPSAHEAYVTGVNDGIRGVVDQFHDLGMISQDMADKLVS